MLFYDAIDATRQTICMLTRGLIRFSVLQYTAAKYTKRIIVRGPIRCLIIHLPLPDILNQSLSVVRCGFVHWCLRGPTY